MSDDILTQSLRDYAHLTNATAGHPLDKPTLSGRAADEIDRLRAEVERLREALEKLRKRVAFYDGVYQPLEYRQSDPE